MVNWKQVMEAALSERRDTHGFRQRREMRAVDSTHIEIDGQRYVNFASNNYLGLTHHPRVIQAFQSAVETNGVGSGAAALVSGYSPAHASAERAIAAWKGTESAVIVGSGYAANLAAVQTLCAVAGQDGVRFLLDKLSHASLIDAVRGSGAAFRVFPHNDLTKLKRLLNESDREQLQVVATESIFSMDGDVADLAGLAKLKEVHPFLLLLDEAHASGVYGPKGEGYAAECGLQPMVDISIVTLSKAIGVYGGAICASRDFCDAAVNFGRSYIYSTNLPASVAAAVETAIEIIQSEPQRRQRLADMTKEFRSRVRESGVALLPGHSPIIPILMGNESQALSGAQKLLDAGFLVVAIRPPTVSRGSSRLRVTLSSEHRWEDIERLINALDVVVHSRAG